VKPLPLVVALILGLVVGYLLGRLPSGQEEIPEVVADHEAAVSQPVPQPAPVPAATPRSAFAPGPPAGATSPNPVPPVSTPPPVAAPADGISNPIDAGPVFNQQFATTEKQGGSDGMLEAHRALEREPRDDSWSYPLEAEIENSLVTDTSMGNFRKEHLECRSTMCELRLSAQGGAQIEALRQWTSDIQKFPWAAGMQLSSSSTVSSDERMDALMIVSKAPAPPDAN